MRLKSRSVSRLGGVVGVAVTAIAFTTVYVDVSCPDD
jgi:hypothetical protein